MLSLEVVNTCLLVNVICNRQEKCQVSCCCLNLYASQYTLVIYSLFLTLACCDIGVQLSYDTTQNGNVMSDCKLPGGSSHGIFPDRPLTLRCILFGSFTYKLPGRRPLTAQWRLINLEGIFKDALPSLISWYGGSSVIWLSISDGFMA